MKKNNCASDTTCYVDYAFKRIGGKYKGRILWYLGYHHLMRYHEIEKVITDATPKMLTQTLRELEDDRLITRTVYPVVPPKVEYQLTDTGKELLPFIDHLIVWAQQQVEKEQLAALCNKQVS